MCGYFIHSYAAIFLHDGFNFCNGCWCHYSVCLTGSRRVCSRTDVVHELFCPFVHLLYWQTCITILNFIRRWISMGFTPLLRCSLVHVASGATIFTLLLRRHVEFLHRSVTCRPLFKPWVLLSTYKTIELCFEFLSYFNL
jgi:hypothetical protein